MLQIRLPQALLLASASCIYHFFVNRAGPLVLVTSLEKTFDVDDRRRERRNFFFFSGEKNLAGDKKIKVFEN